jgi:hypothetical protein
LVLLAVVVAVAALRLACVPPTTFVDGDDAALCAGIAHLTARKPIGPYSYHPPKLPDDASSLGVWVEAAGQEPSLALYRYNTTPGMYLIGQLTDGLGSIAARMSWMCFLAGTAFPLLVSWYLTRCLRLSGLLPLATGYVMVATSPEIWVSGSAYINDKIVAAVFLFAALVAIDAAGSTTWRWPIVLLAGVLLGCAIASRFDMIAFAPAALVAVAAVHDPKTRRPWRDLAVLASAAVATVVAVWHITGASLTSSLTEGASRMEPGLSAAKLQILVSAYGPAQLLLTLIAVLLAARYVLGARARRQSAQPDERPADRIRRAPAHSLVLLLLLVPEVAFWFLFPFSSQKYLLVSSAATAGLCGVLLPHLIATTAWPHGAGRRGRLAKSVPYAVPLAVVAASFLLPLGTVPMGADGPRPLGGELFFRLGESEDSHDARSLVERLGSDASLPAPQLMVSPSWVMEQTFAYECAIRGWVYSLVPAGLSLTWDEALTDGYFEDLSGFWEGRGLRSSSVTLTVAAYTPPAQVGPAILVPSDWDLFNFGNVLVERFGE